MNKELSKPKGEVIRPLITVDTFIEQFDDLVSGNLYRLDSFPSDEEAQKLSKLKVEVTVIELANGNILIAKGLGKTETAFPLEDLLSLKPIKKAHTHPIQAISEKGLRKLADRVHINFNDINQDDVAKMGIIIPSPEDFTLGGVGTAINEIWNEYGKTTYQTYNAEHDELLGFGLEMTRRLYSGSSFMTILVDSSLTIQEKITKMNSLLSSLGLSLKFEKWKN